VTLSVYDLSGKVLLTREEKLAKGINLYAISGLAGGLYILKAGSGNSVQTVKLISTSIGTVTPDMKRYGSAPAIPADRPESDNRREGFQGRTIRNRHAI